MDSRVAIQDAFCSCELKASVAEANFNGQAEEEKAYQAVEVMTRRKHGALVVFSEILSLRVRD